MTRSSDRLLAAYEEEAPKTDRPELLRDFARELAQELERQRHIVDSMKTIGRSLSSITNLDEVLKQIMAKVTELMDCERSSLFLLDPLRGEIWSKIAQGDGVAEIRLPLGSGVAGWVAATGQVVNVVDAYRDPRFNPAVDAKTGYRTRSILCMPMRGQGGDVIGVIQVLNKRERPFDLADESLLEAVIGQAAIALEYAKLYRSEVNKNQALLETQGLLTVKVQELDLLYDIEQSISTATSIDALLDTTIARAMDLMRSEAGSVVLLSEDNQELYFKSALGEKGEEVKRMRLKLGEGIVGWAAQHGKAVVSQNVGNDPRHNYEVAKAIGYPARNIIAVPLMYNNRVLGAMELINKSGGMDFNESDLKLLTLVAGQLAKAVTIHKSREESDRAERLNAVGQMVSGILHDFKTPITIISGYVQLMALEKEAPERQRYSQLVMTQFEHLNSMTREILAFARGDSKLLLTKVYVNKFADEMAEYLKREFEDTAIAVTLEAKYKGLARFDENKIKRVFYNIARNARQAMKDQGKYKVVIDTQGDDFVATFTDSGPGIPEAMRGRLFQSFASYGKSEGTGLGLAIVKKIAEDHGGAVSYESEPGKGTTFRIRFPLGLQGA